MIQLNIVFSFSRKSWEQDKFAWDEKKDELDKKRLKTEDNKSLIEEYSEISKLIFETLKMRQEMKVKTNMSEDEIAAPNK